MYTQVRTMKTELLSSSYYESSEPESCFLLKMIECQADPSVNNQKDPNGGTFLLCYSLNLFSVSLSYPLKGSLLPDRNLRSLGLFTLLGHRHLVQIFSRAQISSACMLDTLLAAFPQLLPASHLLPFRFIFLCLNSPVIQLSRPDLLF